MRTLLVCALLLVGLWSAQAQQTDYPIRPVPFSEVQIKDTFWAPRIRTDIDKTIPFAFLTSEETGRVKNFEIAGGLATGAFCTQYPFDDSDVYKVMEGASYALQVQPDPRLDAYLDTLIYKIGRAQEPDGYLYTNRTIDPEHPHPWAGLNRWEHEEEHSHELYNVGHLYEAAAAHYQATGKRTLLDIALRSADLVDQSFGWDKIVKGPGHQGIEMGLVKLYRVTGDRRYLELAKFFLDARGHYAKGAPYSQSHLPVVEQTEAVGHAVRAAYMYAGMADVAALTNDEAYVTAIDRIWEDVVRHKYYLTGGIGSMGHNEGFGRAYELPNMSAYCETCASIANVMWNHRLFLWRGDAKYVDVLERTLYNALLAGVSLSGDRFFYPNPLESEGQHERKPWFGVACCPSNISRFLPSMPGYLYGHNEEGLYVNLYVSSEATIQRLTGNAVVLRQASNYPWEGRIAVQVEPAREEAFTLFLRIPGWARNEAVPSDLYRFADTRHDPVVLTVNGVPTPLDLDKGYARLHRTWRKGDVVLLELPMPVRKVLAHAQVVHDAGRFALQKGPLVYAVEGKDQADPNVLHLLVSPEVAVETRHMPDLLNGVDVLTFTADGARRTVDGGVERLDAPRLVTAIPYYAWANRGPGQMLVWLPYDLAHTRPLPAPTIAWTSRASASQDLTSVGALADQLLPARSDDHSYRFLHWWPRKGTTEWVQYDFAQVQTVSRVKVYWVDDTGIGECRVPTAWRLFYRDGDTWQPVRNRTPYTVHKDAFDELHFDPVETTALRLEVDLPPDFSAGLHEWQVE